MTSAALRGIVVMSMILAGSSRFCAAVDVKGPLRVKSAMAAEAFPRAGQALPIEVVVKNTGSNLLSGVSVALGSMPDGMTAMVSSLRAHGPMFPGDNATFALEVLPSKPGKYTVPVAVKGGGEDRQLEVSVDVKPSLALPKADYVPEPRPVETAYDIAAICFPGWTSYRSWDAIRNACPERKPVLGWYDEKKPEVLDWQIKWLVENGIKTLYVDWYWDRGNMWQEHWLHAFVRTRYRRYIKWAMLWANHNPKGSHSEDDMRKVTEYWIKNYFCMPEYLKVDGKPVVMIWSPSSLVRDMGREGAAKLLGVSREMAKAAGYEGIQFIAQSHPEAVCTEEGIGKLKDLGYDMTAGYRFMAHKKGIASKKEYFNRPKRYPFKSLADAMPEHWRRLHDIGTLPFIPNISTGWDDRPWKYSLVIYGKNVSDFRRICEEAKKFADETGIRRICVGPLNEWGEGSYAEPNAEFGFGFYESVRDVFCKKPSGGWPLNYGPRDVGLGPYDMMPPLPGEPETWSWSCGEPPGIRRMRGLAPGRMTDVGVAYTTTSNDPRLSLSFWPHKKRAAKFKEVVVRMRTKGEIGNLQLFWQVGKAKIREEALLQAKVIPDGQWHDYRFAVGMHKAWKGAITTLLVDLGKKPGVDVELAEVRLVPLDSGNALENKKNGER